MRTVPILLLSFCLLSDQACAHDLGSSEEHPHYDRSVKPPGASLPVANEPNSGQAAGRPTQAAAFEKFAPAVNLRWDQRFLYVESNGMPAHNMMVGITAWQQQVPLPQNYKGQNAWQIPLLPVPAKEPASIKNRFLRGAIALAANAIPIFNPQNNRGEISQEIGELDEWGGHCGRADDYHYHAAPLHLQSVLGKALPIAYALDGYPIHGLTEPDGSIPTGLDSFNGHHTKALGYHYHASTKYPYVNGGFHGEVVEREQQVDPQPHAQPVREALRALPGAKITQFQNTAPSHFQLTYQLNGEKRAVLYALNTDGSVEFEFQNGREGTSKNSYTRRERGAGQGGKGGPEGGPRGAQDRAPAENRGQRDERRPEQGSSQLPMDALKKPANGFVLTSPAVAKDGKLPADYTGDGSGATPPLTWQGPPAGTRSYALIMDHLAPGGIVKSYWTMWGIPGGTTSLPKNTSGVGMVGTSFKGRLGYEPPHSQGPGEKTYIITLYALSAEPQLGKPPGEVTRDILLTAIKDKVLASASLELVYARQGAGNSGREEPPQRVRAGRDGEPPNPGRRQEPPPPAPERPNPANTNQPPSGDAPPKKQGKPDNKGLIKPTMSDTVHINVYADNWFVMFINGELVAVDPIKFTPHNVVSLDILPEYPMTIAIMAKDNADPKTGLEYGDHVGDGGLVVKFSDGTVTNAKWKAKNFFKGPLANPQQKVQHLPIPDLWWTRNFDDKQWPDAIEYSAQRVNPKQPYFESDFAGAQFIWSEDLDLDNTVIFRTTVEKPGWSKRWNTQPDIDVSNAPYK